MEILELVVEPDRADHIAVHAVRIEEVEQVVYGDPFISRSKQGRYRVIGQTNAGRYLTVIIAPRGAGVFGLVTARDADDAERRRYGRHRRN